MLSTPSSPSTPRATPPLDGGAGGEVELSEEEEIADEPASVALVVTPRPTSEEEEEEEEVGRMSL